MQSSHPLHLSSLITIFPILFVLIAFQSKLHCLILNKHLLRINNKNFNSHSIQRKDIFYNIVKKNLLYRNCIVSRHMPVFRTKFSLLLSTNNDKEFKKFIFQKNPLHDIIDSIFCSYIDNVNMFFLNEFQ